MKRKICISWIMAGLMLGVVWAAHSAPVKVTGGLVEGTEEEGVRVYRGIPFAAPPLGDFRWQAPQSVQPWSGVKAADKFADACIQGRPTEDGKFRDGVSEDCLYLNVWTPAKSEKERLPVMVWIYGGGFAGGATSTYPGLQFAKKGVIYVSVAYRLGVMGFMAHPELSGENANGPSGVYASGNYGLLDQIAGLQWVKDNIAAFGGNPDSVTIFGESAGGISVSILAASPLAKGLFHGAISESGGSFGPTRTPSQPGENIPTLVDAERGGKQLGEKLNASTINKLRALDAAKVVTAARGILGIGWPVLDRWVIPDDQVVLYANNKYNDTPIIVGINSDEGASFSRSTNDDQLKATIQRRFGPFAEKLLKVYHPDADGSLKQAGRDLMREAAFGWHTWKWAMLQSEQGGLPVYVYYFDQRPHYPSDSKRYADIKGAPHGAELFYVFQGLNRNTGITYTDSDRAISKAIADYWVNFAKTGNPNGEGLPHWPAFTRDKLMRMVFNQVPIAMTYDNLEQLNVFDDYFDWRRTLEGKKFVERD